MLKSNSSAVKVDDQSKKVSVFDKNKLRESVKTKKKMEICTKTEEKTKKEMKVLSEKIELNSAAQVLTSGSEWEEETMTNADVRQSKVGSLKDMKSGGNNVVKKRKKKRRIIEKTPIAPPSSSMLKHNVECWKWGCTCKLKHAKKPEKVERKKPTM